MRLEKLEKIDLEIVEKVDRLYELYNLKKLFKNKNNTILSNNFEEIEKKIKNLENKIMQKILQALSKNPEKARELIKVFSLILPEKSEIVKDIILLNKIRREHYFYVCSECTPERVTIVFTLSGVYELKGFQPAARIYRKFRDVVDIVWKEKAKSCENCKKYKFSKKYFYDDDDDDIDIDDDDPRAPDHFPEDIALEPTNGDVYLSRKHGND